MIDIRKKILSILKLSLAEFTDKEINFSVEKPENENFGDYSSNIALALFARYKVLGSKYKVCRTPLELAKKIAQ
ncbi:MAG: hypothetical protein Q8P29_02795, partial [Candidatus Levybacteria bacterium]|nr:hypothetical protein [Candidatus Levybacteria bacterium]